MFPIPNVFHRVGPRFQHTTTPGVTESTPAMDVFIPLNTGVFFFLRFYYNQWINYHSLSLSLCLSFPPPLSLCTCTWSISVKVRGQLREVGSHYHVGAGDQMQVVCQAWQQAPLPTEPSPWPRFFIFERTSNSCFAHSRNCEPFKF